MLSTNSEVMGREKLLSASGSKVRGLRKWRMLSWKTYFHYNDGSILAGEIRFFGRIFRESSLAEANF